ncbi:MAG: hypothetical protein IID40_08955 [Planctomycetes bacterium]|nr:hypothetical protein [Planctomycetota bacterium]
MIAKRWTLGLILGSALLVGVASVQAGSEDEAKKPAPLPNCPVMGEPIDFSVSVAADEGPVFFCCNGCVKKYNAAAEKYAEQVAVQRKALADRPKVQVTCPVSGKPADSKVSIEQSGEKVFFCCPGCVGKYEADPAKYKSELANGYTYQTTCPVMDEEIDPQAFTKLSTGQTIYFCCQKCDKKLLADPEKYDEHLVAQGIQIDWSEVKKKSAD